MYSLNLHAYRHRRRGTNETYARRERAFFRRNGIFWTRNEYEYLRRWTIHGATAETHFRSEIVYFQRNPRVNFGPSHCERRENYGSDRKKQKDEYKHWTTPKRGLNCYSLCTRRPFSVLHNVN